MSISVIDLQPGIEDRIRSAFEETPGRKLTAPIPISTSDGELYVSRVTSVSENEPASLVVEGVILRNVKQWIGGEQVRMELDLSPDRRCGKIEILGGLK